MSACGTLAGAGSNYVLTANLGPTTKNCLVIKAPHVTLDLAGPSVTGAWSGKSGVIVGPGGLSIGILIGPKAVGAKVESALPGAAVTDFVIGIQDNADHAVITGPYLLVDGNVRGGVFVHDATSSVVKQLSLSGNGSAGLHLQRSGSVVLPADIVEGSRVYGIWDEATRPRRS